jgi:hypothetical protein
MKKRYLILGVIAVALCFALGWSHHLWGLWGTWQGDGSLDVLGDSPLDGAVTLEFLPNGTGVGFSPRGEAAFTYSVYHGEMLFLDVEEGLKHGIAYSVKGNTLTLIIDKTEVIYKK